MGAYIPIRWLILTAFLCVWLGSLAGCATRGPYWVKVREGQPVRGILYVSKPCGEKWNGCARLKDGILEIKNDLDQAHQDCVLSHEKRHMAGWDHPEFNTKNAFDKFATDCGNGEVMP